MTEQLKAPFPYFGGKRTVAELVWKHLGNVTNYIEPFFGSGANLLLRPEGFTGVETVSDIDHYVSNFWRATQHEPEEVARHADNPVNEADLHARHLYLCRGEDAAHFRRKMKVDPDYYDTRFAGWWCWGLSCWIGTGWCSDDIDHNQIPRLSGGGQGICKLPELNQQRPFLSNPHNQGVNTKGGLRQQIPRLTDEASVNRRPQLADKYDIGRGVNASPRLPDSKRPRVGDDCSGVTSLRDFGTCEERRLWLLDWFGRLRDRLRNVRVCCGDWKRVCSSESTTTRHGLTGIFLDPPYSLESGRSKGIYSHDSLSVAHEVRRWCHHHGDDELIRICLCGYEGEGHESLEDYGWSVVSWKSNGYGNQSEKGRSNARKERLWFSPNCCVQQKTLFD